MACRLYNTERCLQLQLFNRPNFGVHFKGDGLPYQTIEEADYTVRIPMAHGVDSLNVAAAAAVAFWELRV